MLTNLPETEIFTTYKVGSAWQEQCPIKVMDPDGWINRGWNWTETLLSREEFVAALMESTCDFTAVSETDMDTWLGSTHYSVKIFASLKLGQLFQYNSKSWMRIPQINLGTKKIKQDPGWPQLCTIEAYNALNLTDMTYSWLEPNTLITRIKKCTI